MKLSTKGRYASRLMLTLALHYGKRPVLLREVAEREQISEKYLGQLIAPLKAVGLIQATRGAHGGYSLSRPPEDITLAEVVRGVEGDLDIVGCVSTPEICPRVNLCVTRDIWSQMSAKMTEVLESITLGDMIQQQKQKQQAQPLVYSI